MHSGGGGSRNGTNSAAPVRFDTTQAIHRRGQGPKDLHASHTVSSHGGPRTTLPMGPAGRGSFVSRLYSEIFTHRKADESGDLTRLRPKFACANVNFWYPSK